MKRNHTIAIILAVLLLMMCAVFAGCSDNGNSAASTEAQATENSVTEAATEAAEPETAALEETAAENEGSPLIGSWEYEEGGFTYTFNADGTGTYDVFGEVMNFAYTDNGDSFTMTYEDVDAPTTLEYSIDGNTLTVKDSVGSDVKYIKK